MIPAFSGRMYEITRLCVYPVRVPLPELVVIERDPSLSVRPSTWNHGAMRVGTVEEILERVGTRRRRVSLIGSVFASRSVTSGPTTNG